MKRYPLRVIILLLVALNQAPVFSQTDSILLLNGDLIVGSITEITTDRLTIDEIGKKLRKKFIGQDQIFSYSDSSGEHVLYVCDTTTENDFTISEMRYFIRGEQDAKSGFKAKSLLYTGILVGAAGGLTGSLFFPLPAFAFVALTGVPKVKIKKRSVRNPDDLNHIPYIVGYERMARKNRKIQSLFGGGIGTIAGLGVFLIVKNSGKEIFR